MLRRRGLVGVFGLPYWLSMVMCRIAGGSVVMRLVVGNGWQSWIMVIFICLLWVASVVMALLTVFMVEFTMMTI